MTSGKKLVANVFVDGVMYEAGTTPEKDVADRISNPKAWKAEDDDLVTSEADLDDPADEPKATAKKAASRKTSN